MAPCLHQCLMQDPWHLFWTELWTPKAGEGGHLLAGTICNAIYPFHMA